MIGEKKKLNVSYSILLILVSISIAVVGQVLLKIGIDRIGINGFNSLGSLAGFFSGIVKSPLVLGGLFLYLISAAIWMLVLSAVDLSFAYPFLGLTYVLILVVSKFILKEDVNPLRWIGSLIVIAGVIVVSKG